MIESLVRLIRQKLAALVSRLDEPHEAIGVVMSRQLDAINRMRADLVLVATGEKRVHMLLDQFEEHARAYVAAARSAKARNDRDAAERAMRRALNAERLAHDAKACAEDILIQRRVVESLLEEMRARYQSLRLRRDAVHAMTSAARAVSSGAELTIPVGVEGADSEVLLQRAHDTLVDLRARAAALVELRGSGALDPVDASSFGDRGGITDDVVRERLARLE